MSPALEQKLAFTATLVGSYEAAAQEAANWDCPVDDSVIHALVQRLGAKAEVQTQERLKQAPVESQPQRAASELGLLMLDGWFARFRGPGGGKKQTQQERVEWHEIKNGVFYLQEQAGRTEGGPRRTKLARQKGPIGLFTRWCRFSMDRWCRSSMVRSSRFSMTRRWWS